MVVACRSSHTLLQDEFLSCNLVKKNIHVGSFSVMFLILLSLLMFSTWMVVNSEGCERIKMANNMCSIIMVVLQLIMMRQVHMTYLIDKGQVGRPIPHLMSG
jgi:ABC-type Na+ efflux pump permease subunit